MSQQDAARTSALQRFLEHPRLLTVAFLAVAVACWGWVGAMALDMYGTMQGASAWMMTAHWDVTHRSLLFAMWVVMMIAMMLPSAAPMVILYDRALRARAEPAANRRVGALVAGYLGVWALFSAAATLLQLALADAMLLTPMMEPAAPIIAAGLLALAGVYQLTPLKRACLRACRSPLSFILQHWRPGTAGAFRLGVDHGAYCLGCCWALMMLLFAGGVMNLVVIVALTLWVLVEKVLPLGEHTTRVSGVALLALAAWSLIG
jgi:predicted metal-binding membrane protein